MIDIIKQAIKKILGLKNPHSLDELKKKGLRVGKNFNLQNDCIIDVSHCWHITIGDNVTLAPRVHVLAHDASTYNYIGYTKVLNTIIGNNVFIGAGSIIMPGCTIKDNVIIGAGSVVTKNIPENSVYAGNPAKFICYTDAYISKQKERMHKTNCFDSNYTIQNKLSFEMKEKLQQIVTEHGQCFIK